MMIGSTRRFGNVHVVGFLGDADRFHCVCVDETGKLLNIPRADVRIVEIEGSDFKPVDKPVAKVENPVPQKQSPTTIVSQKEIQHQKALDNRPPEAKGSPVKIEGDEPMNKPAKQVDELPPANLDQVPQVELTPEQQERAELAKEYAEQQKAVKNKNK